MADRTIKPDDTNDLVLQNNDGSAKLELNEDQTVKVTTGSDAGEDFTVNSTKLVVEGDTGNVGINTATPGAYKLAVTNGDSSATQKTALLYSGKADKLALLVQNGNTANTNTDYLADFQNGTAGGQTAVAIRANGQIVLGTNGGITFGGDPDSRNASSATPSDRTLYDYEEGTFTPTFANITVGNAVVTGKYTKIGNLVYVYGAIKYGTTTTGPSSTITSITGLPFLSQLAVSDEPLTVIMHFRDSLNYDIQGFGALNHSTNYINYPQRTVTSSYQTVNLTTPFSWTTGDVLSFNATYRV